MQSHKLWFSRYFNKMWEDRPWWFNVFIATPAFIATLVFLPIGYFVCPPFRRYVNGICGALDDSYAHIHETHKHDGVEPPPQDRVLVMSRGNPG